MPKAKSHKLLCIVGATGTGKTALAVKLSKSFPSVLISADSRQVYKGMDIVTGKDHPSKIEMGGVDIVNPNEKCSVAVWQQSIDLDLEYAETTGKLPIFVGGTGLYIKSIIVPINTVGIPIDEKLRKQLSGLSTEELQNRLRILNPARLYDMNHSDVSNPRRLIRAIEVAEFSKHQLKEFHFDRPNIYDQLIVGIQNYDYSNNSRIKERVIKRIKIGAIEETEKLLEKYSPTLPSMSALGYKHIIRYLNKELTEEEMINNWTRDELSYAKRQMTWFKKMNNIHWFDTSVGNALARVEELVKTWYHQS